MNPIDVDQWRKEGQHLPPVLRDFHDQKDLFKAMHRLLDVKHHDYAKDISWVAGQCYVVDIFLWFMAARGYTLQKVRQPGNFRDYHAEIAALKEEEAQIFMQYLDQRRTEVKRATPEDSPCPTVTPA